MRPVKKGDEPACLLGVRVEIARIERESGHTHPDPWGELKECAPSVRAALRRDQGGLCAYCGGSLPSVERTTSAGRRTFEDQTKIEHFVPRSQDPSMALHWRILLGVCRGEYDDSGRRVLHCDSSRTPYKPGPPERGVLEISPLDPAEVLERELPMHEGHGENLGRILPQTPRAETAVCELNLNAPRLVQNRAQAIQQLRRDLDRAGARDLPLLEKRYQEVTNPTPGEPTPFAHVLAVFLRKKLEARRRRA